MRLLEDFPDVEKKIEAGTFNLSTAAAAQSFFKKEPVAPEKKKEILAAIEGKSTLKVEKTLLSFSENPVSHLREKRIKAVTPELSEVHFFANDELLDQLEKLKGLLAHSHPNMTTGDLVAYLARMGLERLDPAANVRAAWQRDDGRCVWRNSKTGKICGSRYRVQTDHVIPWAFGGDHAVENLRCLCFRHNQMEAERWFGKRRARPR